jgi:hypothetical protein
MWTPLPGALRRARARRWLLPFSRELSMGGITQMPLLPWTWKMALMRAWLASGFFRPAGLEHMMPSGDASDMDYAGERGPATSAAPSVRRTRAFAGSVQGALDQGA